MSGLNKQEQFAIAAVARRFSATFEKSGNPSRPSIIVAKKRIAIEIAVLKPRGARRANVVRPHLRFDRVVLRLMERLQTAFAQTVPNGTTVLLTVTAPIRLASKTTVALEDKVQTLLRRESPLPDAKEMIHGNRIHIRILRGLSASAPKMIGFVHNLDSDPLLLLNMSQELLDLAGSAAISRTASRTGDRWLVVLSDRGISCLEAYRYIYSHLRMPAIFKKILIVFSDGQVEGLTK